MKSATHWSKFTTTFESLFLEGLGRKIPNEFTKWSIVIVSLEGGSAYSGHICQWSFSASFEGVLFERNLNTINQRRVFFSELTRMSYLDKMKLYWATVITDSQATSLTARDSDRATSATQEITKGLEPIPGNHWLQTEFPSTCQNFVE